MQTLVALEHILLNSVPTFILVWLLYAFISRGFLAPLRNVLQERAASTEGLRQAAEKRVSLAEQRASEYQEALRAGSAEIYKQQEQERQKALQQRAERVRQARLRAEERILQARQELQNEAEQAKKSLAQESEQIARWIVQAVLTPSRAEAAAEESR